MPWDGTDLWVADYAAGKISNIQHVAGGPTESIFQPQWSPCRRTPLRVAIRPAGGTSTKIMNLSAPWRPILACPNGSLACRRMALLAMKSSLFISSTVRHILARLPPLRPIDLGKTFLYRCSHGKGFAVFICGSAHQKVKWSCASILATQKIGNPRPQPRAPHRSRLLFKTRTDRLSQRRWPHGLWLFLSPLQ